jgi:hypothetical protein
MILGRVLVLASYLVRDGETNSSCRPSRRAVEAAIATRMTWDALRTALACQRLLLILVPGATARVR